MSMHNSSNTTPLALVNDQQAPGKIKRAAFNQKQRLEICLEAAYGPKKTQEQMCHWAKRQFNMDSLPSQSTISKIIKKSKELSEMSDKELSASSSKKAHYPELEEELSKLIVRMSNENVAINKHSVLAYATHLVNSRPELTAGKAKPLFSNGWISNFMKRHDLKSRQMNGEAGSVQIDAESVATQVEKLKKEMEKYELKDILNFDETGLFYRASPTSTIADHNVSGIKFDKTRMTIGLLCSADGSIKYDALIIGKHEKPRCFNRKTGMLFIQFDI